MIGKKEEHLSKTVFSPVQSCMDGVHPQNFFMSRTTCIYMYKTVVMNDLKTFAPKFSNIDFFLKISPLKDDELVMSEM